MTRLVDILKPAPAGILLLAMTPGLMVVIPWDFGSDSTAYRAFMRDNMLPATTVEFLFALLVMARGFSPFAALRSLPRATQIGLSMLAVGSAWTTAVVAAYPVMAAIGLIKFFAHLMFGLAFAHQMAMWTQVQRQQIWPSIGIGVIGFCLLWGANIVFYHPVGNDWARLVPTLTNVRWAGLYALAIFCAGVGMIRICPDGETDRFALALAILFGASGIAISIWTGTRAAIGAIFFATILSAAVLPVRRQLLVMAFCSAAIGVAVGASLPVVHPYYGLFRMIGASSSVIDGGDVSSGRLQIWIDMLGKIIDRPIMGWGIDQFRYSFPEGTPRVRHPHNGVMQLIFSSGFFGLVAAAMIALSFVKEIPKKFSESYQIASVAFVAGSCVYGLFDGFFYFTYPVIILLVAVCCLVAPKPRAPVTDRSG